MIISRKAKAAAAEEEASGQLQSLDLDASLHKLQASANSMDRLDIGTPAHVRALYTYQPTLDPPHVRFIHLPYRHLIFMPLLCRCLDIVAERVSGAVRCAV